MGIGYLSRMYLGRTMKTPTAHLIQKNAVFQRTVLAILAAASGSRWLTAVCGLPQAARIRFN